MIESVIVMARLSSACVTGSWYPFAVLLTKSSAGVGNESSVVGHAPIKISRILYFALEHGCQLRDIC